MKIVVALSVVAVALSCAALGVAVTRNTDRAGDHCGLYETYQGQTVWNCANGGTPRGKSCIPVKSKGPGLIVWLCKQA